MFIIACKNIIKLKLLIFYCYFGRISHIFFIKENYLLGIYYYKINFIYNSILFNSLKLSYFEKSDNLNNTLSNYFNVFLAKIN